MPRAKAMAFISIMCLAVVSAGEPEEGNKASKFELSEDKVVGWLRSDGVTEKTLGIVAAMHREDIGRETVCALVDRLIDPNFAIALKAFEALQRHPRRLAEQADHLRAKYVQHGLKEGPGLLAALEFLDADNERVLADLRTQLRADSEWVRLKAMRSLWVARRYGWRLFEELKALTKDGSAPQRSMGLLTQSKVLERLLKVEDQDVNKEDVPIRLQGLVQFAQAAAAEANQQMKVCAVDALERVAPFLAPDQRSLALKVLRNSMGDEDDYTRTRALLALLVLGENVDGSLERLEAAVVSKSAETFSAVIRQWPSLNLSKEQSEELANRVKDRLSPDRWEELREVQGAPRSQE